MGRSIEIYVEKAIEERQVVQQDEIEQEVFLRFIEPVQLLQGGFAWVYASDHVIGKWDSRGTDGYRGTNLAAILTPQGDLESSNQEMFDAVLFGREGVGWYIGKTEVGKEITAWTPVSAGPYTWVIGISTPLSEILSTSGVSVMMNRRFYQAGLESLIVTCVLILWGALESRRVKTAKAINRSYELLEEQVATRTNELTELNRSLRNQVVERKQVEFDLQKQVNRLKVLNKMDTLATAGLDLHIVLHYLLEQAVNELVIDAACVWIKDQRTLSLYWLDGIGFRGLAEEQSRVIKSGDAWAGQIAFSGDAISFPDLDRDTRGWKVPDYMKDEGFQAYYALALKSKGQIKGVLELFSRNPLYPQADWAGFIETLANQAAMAIDNFQLYEQLQQSNASLTLAYDATLEGWSRAIELHDQETEGHSQRVADMTVRLAQYLGMNSADLLHLRRGALLHDVGKMGISDKILQKPERLTKDETRIIQQHPEYAYRMLSPINYLKPALDIPYCHHERWDGTGYPRGLKGEEIPIAARIFAIVDVWDALRSNRSYRPSWTVEQVKEYLFSQSGRQFDPQVVIAFFELMGWKKGEGLLDLSEDGML